MLKDYKVNTNQSMHDFIKEVAFDKNREKINYFGNKITAEVMFEEVDKIAGFLQQRVAVGESVAICLPNIPQAIFAFYAINKIGAVANIVHPKIKTPALIKILEETNTKWIFILDKFLSIHSRQLKENGIMAIGCSAGYYMKGFKKILLSADVIFYPKNAIKFTDIIKEKTIEEQSSIRNTTGQSSAVLLHSSGTSGEPKTVVLSNYAFNELAYNVYKLVTSSVKVDLNGDDGMLMILPMFHGFGLGICVHLMMFYGRTVLLPVYREKAVVSLMKKESVEIISGVPSMFRRLADYKKFGGDYLSKLKLIFCGGDKLESAVKEKFEGILQKYGSETKIMEGYGLSETASVVTINIDGKNDGSLGVPLPGVELKIEESAEYSKEKGVGEILISTPSLMKGYLNGKNPTTIDKKGRIWLHTGDIGYLDENGKLHYRGREKRMIKIGGVNIFPQEVEQKAEELPEVVYACAVRIIFENKPALKLIVVTKDHKLSPALKYRITSKIREELLPYAVPKIIEKAEKMELNVMGKVDYKFYEKAENNKGISS